MLVPSFINMERHCEHARCFVKQTKPSLFYAASERKKKAAIEVDTLISSAHRAPPTDTGQVQVCLNCIRIYIVILRITLISNSQSHLNGKSQ